MRVKIENERLVAEIETFGAELKSIVRKEDGKEIMWEADPKYWGKTSPILFPFIGKCQDEVYRLDGKTYPAGKHGFARDMEFAVLEQSEDRILLGIESNDETFAKYPYKFALKVEYTLDEDALTEMIHVENRNQENMYFNLGGHPAFACPGGRLGKYVKFYGPEAEEILATEIDVKAGLLTGDKYRLDVLEDNCVKIVDHIFDNDALVVEDQGVYAVGILDNEGIEYVHMSATNCPVWGIWSMPTSEASYICIEPWWGICDAKGYAGTLQERPYTNEVEAGQTWSNGFTINVL